MKVTVSEKEIDCRRNGDEVGVNVVGDVEVKSRQTCHILYLTILPLTGESKTTLGTMFLLLMLAVKKMS